MAMAFEFPSILKKKITCGAQTNPIRKKHAFGNGIGMVLHRITMKKNKIAFNVQDRNRERFGPVNQLKKS
jgi:hypothetical protein